jgi:hypothetical protein
LGLHAEEPKTRNQTQEITEVRYEQKLNVQNDSSKYGPCQSQISGVSISQFISSFANSGV